MLKVGIRTIGCVAALCGLAISAGCSRKEEPARGAGAGKAEKPAVAKPESAGASLQPKPAGPGRDAVTNAPRISDDESMRQAIARSKEFRWNAFEKALQEMGKEIGRLEAEMVSAEAVARTNAPVAEAWATLGKKRAAYDAERVAIPGMKELYEKREAAKARMAEARAKAAAPSVSELRAEIRRLGRDMMELELKGRAGSASLRKALDEFRAAESAYRDGLLATPSFGGLAQRHEELSEQVAAILERQTDLLKEGRKNE